MSSPHFTPGSWRRDSHRAIVSSGGLLLCEVFSGAVGIEQADANEHLIATAPDLFTALRAALVVVAGCNADHAFDVEERMIRNTLARAFGIVSEPWTPALFLADKRVFLLPAARSESEAFAKAEAVAALRSDVEWIAARRSRGTQPPELEAAIIREASEADHLEGGAA